MVSAELLERSLARHGLPRCGKVKVTVSVWASPSPRYGHFLYYSSVAYFDAYTVDQGRFSIRAKALVTTSTSTVFPIRF